MPDPVTLNDTQKAYLAEIIGCEHPDNFASELLTITSAQETILKADVALWITVRDDFDSIKSPKSGIDSNPLYTRKAIRNRILTLLDVWHLAKAGVTSTILLRA